MESQFVALLVLLLTAFSDCSPRRPIVDIDLEEESLVSELSFDGQADDDHVLRFTLFGNTRSLTLTPANEVFSENFRMKRANNGTVVDYVQAPLRGQFFTEKNGPGSFYVENLDGQLRVDGVVDKRVRIRHFNGAHRAYRASGEFPIDAFINDVVPIHVRKEASEVTEPPILSAELPDAITVEVYSVIDKTLQQGLEAADMPVVKYLGILWNFVNKEYETTSAPRISFAVTGTFLLGEADWIQSTVVGTNNNVPLVNSHELLDKFGDWLFSEAKEGKLLTMTSQSCIRGKLDLGSPTKDGQISPANLGVAFGGGVCIFNNGGTVISCGLMEDLKPSKFILNGIVTVAHEVAHLFGAIHDDEEPKAKHCPEHYLMYSSVGYDTTEKFSECSMDDMRKHLSLRRSACVLDEVSVTSIPLRTPDKPKPVTQDEVCTERYGKKTRAFPSIALPQGTNICKTLYCFTSPTGGSWNGEPSPDGMICDEKKICMKGNCEDEEE